MFDFFSQVLGFLEAIWEFFLQLLDTLLVAVQLLAQAIIFPIELVGFLPAFFGTCLLITISICVVKFILGR